MLPLYEQQIKMAASRFSSDVLELSHGSISQEESIKVKSPLEPVNGCERKRVANRK